MNEALEQVIRERAFAIWEREGGSGAAAEHWLNAEREVIAAHADPASLLLRRFKSSRSASKSKPPCVTGSKLAAALDRSPSRGEQSPLEPVHVGQGRSVRSAELPRRLDDHPFHGYWASSLHLGAAAAWMWLSVAAWSASIARG